ncbi:MAG: hypothetical protein DWQ31_00130 [Planctomycetota bacterium]|nr:MAG: hypothetical protein DWQ31_00130 [Planctomycetota bacterium]REJ92876.1 MAG: hypothetical protein DWQ35_11305 [Planctomycetota bacterium]
MRHVVPLLVAALLVLHQDDWFFGFWAEPKLVFGFLPATLLYHAGISLAAGLTWYLAVTFCWPEELDAVEPESSESEAGA